MVNSYLVFWKVNSFHLKWHKVFVVQNLVENTRVVDGINLVVGISVPLGLLQAFTNSSGSVVSLSPCPIREV